MRRISAAVAAITLVASAAAQAQGPGKGNGGGNGHDGGHPSAEHGGGHGGGDKGARGHGPGGGDGGASMQGGGRDRGDSAHDRGPAHVERVSAPPRPAVRDDRGPQRVVVDDKRHDRGPPRIERDRGHDDRTVIVERGRGDVVRVGSFAPLPPHRMIVGCPPGLAKKHNGCQPPGHARPVTYVRYDRPDFWGLRLDPGRYWYDNGYLVRLGPDGRAGGYVPLLGGALALGNPWPTYYEPVALPNYYVDYYDLGPYDAYRYADNVIYRVDPKTAAITSIAALLTGDQFTVGQPMPLGYDVYNVPYDYRSRYVDGPDALYRYADGYVYQVDPETRLIAAAIELLAT